MSLPTIPPDAAPGVEALIAPGAPVRQRRLGLVGTPSAMTHWGIHLARVAVGAIEGDHAMAHGNTLAEFAGLATGSHPACGHRTVICTSDCPEVALGRFLTEGPVALFAEEPADIIDDLVAVSGIDPVNALRLATRSLCALQPLIGAPGVTVFGRRHLDGEMADFMEALLLALRLAPTKAQREEIDRQLASGGAVASVREHVGRLFPAFAARRRELGRGSDAETLVAAEPMPAAAIDLLAGTLPGIGTAGVKAVALAYEPLAAGLPLETAEWPAAIFSSGDAIGAFLAGPCEMVGPARIMIYGPYMHLPPGAWVARVEMEVADNASGNRLRVDLACGARLLVSAAADMPLLGQYTFALEFRVAEPLDPLELRFQIESGAIEGRFLLRRVVMTPQPAS